MDFKKLLRALRISGARSKTLTGKAHIHGEQLFKMYHVDFEDEEKENILIILN